MSTIIAQGKVEQRESSDFAWMAPTIVILLLLIGTIGVISGFPVPNVVGPDGLLAFP